MMSTSEIKARVFNIQLKRKREEDIRNTMVEAFTHGFCPDCGSTKVEYSFGLIDFLMSRGKYHCKDCLFTLKIRSWEH